jgi:hypothetical protein
MDSTDRLAALRRSKPGELAASNTHAAVMPIQDRLGLEDFECVEHLGGEAIEPDKQRPIDSADGHSLRRFAPKDIELMSKD